jgi:hypothetical protein
MNNVDTTKDDALLTKLAVARHHLETALSAYEEIRADSAFAARCQGLIDDIEAERNEAIGRVKLGLRAEEALKTSPAPAR